ncbi:DUF7362 domain-containing protein [Nocardia amikacinitolerans]
MPPSRRRRAAATRGPDEVSAALLAALGDQRLDLVLPVDVVPSTDGARRGTRRALEPGTLRVDLDVAADEDAVILLEQDDFLSWQFPVAHVEPSTPAGGRRRGEPQQPQVVRFQLDVRLETPIVRGGPTRTRGKPGAFRRFRDRTGACVCLQVRGQGRGRQGDRLPRT